jgi:hypothetical protein
MHNLATLVERVIINTTNTATIKGRLAQAVANGARMLDVHRPGWEKTVKDSMIRGLFNMDNWDHCMVGTLEMFKYVGSGENVIAFNGLEVPVDDAFFYGFDVDRNYHTDIRWTREFESHDGFVELDRLWRLEIEARTGEYIEKAPTPVLDF